MSHAHSHGTSCSHDHDHGGHAHHHAPSNFNLAFGLAVSLNLAFTVVETIYALAAHSMSLLADAGHNLGDVCGLLMAWGASWLLGRTATAKYSYGYKKTTLFAALINALLLVFACGIIIFESVRRLFFPAPINELIVIIVALIGIAINGGTALMFLKGSKDDLNIKGAYLHLASDALLSLGVVITGCIVWFTKWMWLDPIVGLIIVFIILYSTLGLLRHSVDLLLGAVPHNVDQQKVFEYLSHIDGVTAVHDLHIWALSTKEFALTAHLVMPDRYLTDHDYLEINQVLKDQFKIGHVTIQVEKGESADPCGQAVVC